MAALGRGGEPLKLLGLARPEGTGGIQIPGDDGVTAATLLA
jgi:hypothetical protein